MQSFDTKTFSWFSRLHSHTRLHGPNLRAPSTLAVPLTGDPGGRERDWEDAGLGAAHPAAVGIPAGPRGGLLPFFWGSNMTDLQTFKFTSLQC